MARSRILLFSLLLIIVLALTLTACGDDDDEKTDPTVEPTTETVTTDMDTDTDADADADMDADADTDTDADTPTGRTTIVLADVSDDPEKKFKRFQPIADYLGANLSEFGITEGVVMIAPDMDTMVQWLSEGTVDMAFDSVYPAMYMRENAGAQPVLRRWKDGVSEYTTIIFVRNDSGIESLDDLKGQMVAFDEPDSTSGYMVPFYHLTEAGYALDEKRSATTAVSDDEIGFVFSSDDENTIQWTISGRVAAGVVDNDTYLEIPEETRDQLTILLETEPVPRQVAMARGDMDPDLLAAVIELLINLDETEEGPEILDTFKTSQLDEFPQGADAALSEMEAMYELIKEQ